MNQFFNTRWCGLFLLFLLPALLPAQGVIKGKVTDADSQALAGATAVIKALNKGAFVDEAGAYQFTNVPAGTHTVSVTLLGYAAQEQRVTLAAGQTLTLNFVLKEEGLSTEEIVVVGYGVSRKRDLVGSVSKIESANLNDIPGGSFENSLQGKAPGLQVVQSSGVAGAGAVVRVRGIGSLSSGGDPLYVVDGIPITQDNFINNEVNANGGGLNNNPLSFLNPNDIESVEVLKDASAAAIYGSRGANGVILITTKRGKAGKPQFNFNTRVGVSRPTRVLEVLNAQEWLQVRQEAWENDGNVGRAPLPLGLDYEDIEGVDTDWISQVLQTGLKQEYNLSMRQGGKKLSSYVGVSWLDGESYQKGNSWQRATGRANIDYNIRSNMKLSLSTSLARGFNDRIRQAFAGGLGTAQTTALPIYPIKDNNGKWFNIYNNPVAQEQLQDWKTLEWRTINNLNFNYKASERLDFNVSGSYDYMNLGDYYLEDSLWTTVGDIAKGWKTRVNNFNTFATVNYEIIKDPKNHKLRVLGGTEYQGSFTTNRYLGEYRSETHLFNNPVIPATDTLNRPFPVAPGEFFDVDKWKFFSLFGRLNYSFKDKYLAQVTFRRDGSSKFGSNRRFGNFPSLGVGWIVSEEPFLKGKSAINFLKLKASWGMTGNADISWREQFADYAFGNPNAQYNDVPIRVQTKLENPNLQWELANTYDAGFEIGLWNDRLTMDATYYYRLTTDAIIYVSIQASSGIDNLRFAENVGKIENQGVEFNMTSRNLVGQFKWTTKFNISHNNNKVLEVGTATADALAGGFGDTRAIPGYAVNTNFIVRWQGVDPQTGRPIYLTREGQQTNRYDVVNDRVAVGNGLPLFTGGFTNEFRWKNFDLEALLYFSYGGEIYDDAAKRQMGVVTDWNMRRDIFDRWQKPGDIAKYPQLTMSMINWGGNANFWQNNHSLWLEDASYARLRYITFGYTLKPQNSKIRGLRFSLNATNLLTLTKFSGWDPEVARERSNPQERNIGGTNITYLTAPNEKTVTVGLNLDF